MDIISYFLLRKFFKGKITVPVYNYFQLGTYDPDTLSVMASRLLADLDKEQTGTTEKTVRLPVSKLVLFGIFSPISS